MTAGLAVPAPPPANSPAPALLRLALRRDRVMIPAWVVVLALLVVRAGSSFEQLYGTAAERADLAAAMTAQQLAARPVRAGLRRLASAG